MVEILKFEAEWCDPCKEQDEILDDVLANRSNGVTVRHVDVEERGNTELKRRFEPRALPTTIILVDDQPVKQFTGLVDAETLNQALDEAGA